MASRRIVGGRLRPMSAVERRQGAARKKRRLRAKIAAVVAADKRRIEEEITRRGLKSEPIKPGRYAEYYNNAGKLYSFMSMDEERLWGSTPGSFFDGMGMDPKKMDPTKPQIAQVPLIS